MREYMKKYWVFAATILSAVAMQWTDYALWTVVLANTVAIVLVLLSIVGIFGLWTMLYLIKDGIAHGNNATEYHAEVKTRTDTKTIILIAGVSYFVVVLYHANTFSGIMATLYAVAYVITLGTIYTVKKRTKKFI